jgi:hypothetical protein
MRRFTRGIVGALTLLALAAAGGGGCESDSKDDLDDRDIYRRDRAERRRERDLDRDLPRDRDRVRADDRVISRDPDRRADAGRRRGIDEIPAEAVAVEAGEGRSGMTYTAERDGTVYVYDVDEDRVIHVGRMMANERFRLLPEDDEATLDGRPVFRSDLNPRHRYRLYFDRRG